MKKSKFKFLIKEVNSSGRKSQHDETIHETFSWPDAKKFMKAVNKGLRAATVYVKFEKVCG